MKVYEAAYIAGVIDGEGSITLTRMHAREHRRPVITIASTDKELLTYLQSITGGCISNKKNYKPGKHKNSFTLNIKVKREVFYVLEMIEPYLRINQKKKRALWILNNYDRVTNRNGKYTNDDLLDKLKFEEEFFAIK
ncbi:LAGLIDADG family homing endonuclease [Pseudalkalibacillus sp. SCS-8]|uniref:LAGLIDADG family homing endonuclease n=1 Tax=Pseudalkalibacillus nanhaiensis TaxID=3115291 RepID=UPI0032D9D25E